MECTHFEDRLYQYSYYVCSKKSRYNFSCQKCFDKYFDIQLTTMSNDGFSCYRCKEFKPLYDWLNQTNTVLVRNLSTLDAICFHEKCFEEMCTESFFESIFQEELV
jgi:hypothetical protein